jgi:hypothetical protein
MKLDTHYIYTLQEDIYKYEQSSKQHKYQTHICLHLMTTAQCEVQDFTYLCI